MRFHLIPKFVPVGSRYQLITHENNQLDYFTDETMNGSFLELLRRPWYFRMFFQPWMSWEIEAMPESIKYFYWTPSKNIGEEVKHKILAYHPDIEIWPAETVKLELQNYTKGTRLSLRRHYAVTIKTFFNSIVDTQAPILTAMTDLKTNEKAYIQILLRPAIHWERKVRKAQKQVSKWIEDATTELVSKAVHGKAFKQCGEVEIRIIAESPDKERAKQIIRNITRSFGQFSSESLNSFVAKEFHLSLKPLLLHDFKKRIFPFYTFKNRRRVLNIEELSGLVRLPGRNIQIPQLLRLRMKKIAAPVEIMNLNKNLQEGIISDEQIINLGKNVFGFQQVSVWFKLKSLSRHMMIFGATQMGKSSFVVNLAHDIMQLKLKGHKIGFEVIDPHGSLCQDIAALVPPELLDCVDYVKPYFEKGAFPFNIYDVDFQSSEDRIAQSVADALSRIWPEFWGPNIDDCLLQAGIGLLKLGRANIFNVRRLLSNKKFRKEIIEELVKLEGCEPIVEFFQKLDDLPERSLNERTNSTLNKLRKIEASDTLRNSLGQKNCGIRWRGSMDEGRITLLDLSELSEDEKRIIGSIALTRRHQAALSRIDMPEEDRTLFLEIIDESSKFMAANEKAIEDMADECRKFNLGLVAASQGMDKQIPPNVAAAILRNFGSLIVYRVPSPEDAKTLALTFSHTEIFPEHIQKIDKNNAYMRLADGRDTTKAFSCQMKAPEPIDATKMKSKVEQLIKKTLERCVVKAKVDLVKKPKTNIPLEKINSVPAVPNPTETFDLASIN